MVYKKFKYKCFSILILSIYLIISIHIYNKVFADSSFKLKTKENSEILVKNEIDTNCTKGKAEPIISNKKILNSTFKLQSDSITGIETLYFPNNEIVIIKNWGCEYYNLTFNFQTKRFNKNITDLKYWYKKSYILLNEVSKFTNPPINIKEGIQSLKSYKSKSKKIILSKKLVYGNGEIPTLVSVDSISKRPNNFVNIQITFSYGPL